MTDAARVRAERRFETRLAARTLESERLRTGILAGLFGLLFVYGVLTTSFVRLNPESLLGGASFPARIVLPAILVTTAYELVVRRFVGLRMREGRPLPGWIWFVNATVEISLPTATLLLLVGRFDDPTVAVSGPVMLVYFPFIVLSTLRLDPRVALYTGVMAAAQYTAIALLAVHLRSPDLQPPALGAPMFHVSRAAVVLAAGAAAAFVAREIRRRVSETFRLVDERDRVTRIFGQHTSPAVVDVLLREDGDPSSERRSVCVLVLDVRDFTAFSETRDPSEVVDYVNELFGFMVPIVQERNGFVQHFTGDGLVAVFGAPIDSATPVEDAIGTARSILDRLDHEVGAGTIPATELGIGIHAGEAMVGTVGSDDHREFKVMGDTVNTAARIEDLCKEHDARILVSESVLRQAEAGDVRVRDLGDVPIRGRTAPVRIFALA